MDGARADPKLHGHKRRAAIFLEQDNQAVIENQTADALIGCLENVYGIFSHCRLLDKNQSATRAQYV